jgi:hypothetical protein
MSKVIEMNNWKTTKEEYRVLHREEKETQLTEVEYMYFDCEEGIWGTPTIIDHCDFASIETLRQDIEVQRKALETGFDDCGEEIDFDEIIPCGEDVYLVCKEGVFSWDLDSEDYKLIGMIRRTERRRVVDIYQDAQVFWEGNPIMLRQGVSYHLDTQYIAYVDEFNPVTMLVIKSDGCVPIAVPYIKELMSIHCREYAVITETDF